MILNNSKAGRAVAAQAELPTTSASRKTPKAPVRKQVHVTVDMAKAWLEKHNTINRHVRWTDVREYARRMDAGEWTLNGECLKFDEDGNLFEGQHRLHAVVMHGKPVWFEVIENAPSEERFNDGGRPRTMADYIAIAGLCEQKDAVRVAAMVEVIASLIEGKPRSFRARRSDDKNEAINIARAWKAALDWGCETFAKGAYAPLVGAFVYAYGRQGEKVVPFVRYYLSANRSDGHAAVALDKMIEEARTSPRGSAGFRLEISQRTLTAIHYGMRGKKVRVLRRAEGVNALFGGE